MLRYADPSPEGEMKLIENGLAAPFVAGCSWPKVCGELTLATPPAFSPTLPAPFPFLVKRCVWGVRAAGDVSVDIAGPTHMAS